MSKACHVGRLIPIRAKHTEGILLLQISYHDKANGDYFLTLYIFLNLKHKRGQSAIAQALPYNHQPVPLVFIRLYCTLKIKEIWYTVAHKDSKSSIIKIKHNDNYSQQQLMVPSNKRARMYVCYSIVTCK